MRRTLAIDASPYGFGFAILEEPQHLIDWGIKYARGDKNASCLRGTQELLEWYGPEILVVEDTRRPDSMRRKRVRSLFPKLRKLAARMRVAFDPIPWTSVREICGGSVRATKETIAAAMAARFPELASRLPPHRKVWMREDPRASIFDAVAMAVTSLEMAGKRKQQ